MKVDRLHVQRTDAGYEAEVDADGQEPLYTLPDIERVYVGPAEISLPVGGDMIVESRPARRIGIDILNLNSGRMLEIARDGADQMDAIPITEV